MTNSPSAVKSDFSDGGDRITILSCNSNSPFVDFPP
jgi:hypothetical protein